MFHGAARVFVNQDKNVSHVVVHVSQDLAWCQCRRSWRSRLVSSWRLSRARSVEAQPVAAPLPRAKCLLVHQPGDVQSRRLTVPSADMTVGTGCGTGSSTQVSAGASLCMPAGRPVRSSSSTSAAQRPPSDPPKRRRRTTLRKTPSNANRNSVRGRSAAAAPGANARAHSSAAHYLAPPVTMKNSFSDYILGIQEEKAMSAAPTMPIDGSKFVQYVMDRRKKKILFKGELLVIKKLAARHTMEAAASPDVADRNNYPEILPYDYNRVVLPLIPGQPSSHYVNASYVDCESLATALRVEHTQTRGGLAAVCKGSMTHAAGMAIFLQPSPADDDREQHGDADADRPGVNVQDVRLMGFKKTRQFIVTQSVKSKVAVVEFWRMVWEMHCTTIVMLTRVFDFMRVMCLQYWPVTKFTYGNIEVETLSTVIRTLRIKHAGESRTITQFHFTEWELDSFPYVSAFLELRRRVRKHIRQLQNPNQGPTIVHCSNGGMRSGAYIAVDACLDMLKDDRSIDVFGFCKKLHNTRMGLVDNVDQYQFIYDTLCEAVECNFEPLSLDTLTARSAHYKSRKDRERMEKQDTQEYKVLNKLTPHLRIGDCAGGHRIENRGKNRDVMVVPPDHARPYLNTLHGESKDYTFINAVFVDGHSRKNEWIVTEWPKHSTIDSFWTLVFDHSCHTVVNLSNQASPKTYPNFIHDKGKHVYGPFIVEVLNYQAYPTATLHTVKVMKRTFMVSELMASSGASSAKMSTNQLNQDEVRVCCVINVKMWPIENHVPLSTAGLLDVVKMCRHWKNRAPDRPDTRPAIVMSHNGVSRCGIFIGANHCIDQMAVDGEIDVFHSVKMIRINRPQLVDTKDEYKYLYDFMLHWYMTNPEFVNKGRATTAAAGDASPNANANANATPVADGALATATPTKL